MLKDMEGNAVTFSQTPNSHMMILGQSGMGKTFFLCRKMEEAVSNGKTILIVDFSGSFTSRELKKNQFQYMESITILNLLKKGFTLRLLENEMRSDLTNAIFKILIKQGYFQKKLLREAVDKVFENKNCFSIPSLIETLELLSNKREDEERKNIFRLLSKLDCYSEIKKIFISPRMGHYRRETQIYIIQVSGYGEIQRKFCVEFLSELIWQNFRHGWKMFDVTIFDEFQSMELKPGSALSAMLREGRKYGLSVWLASQFLGNYDKEAVETLMQAGNKIFFRPTENDERAIADFVDPNSNAVWRKILHNLHRGEAVLKGNYTLNDLKSEIQTPIICKIEA